MGVSGWIGIVAFAFAASMIIYVGLLLSWSTSKVLMNDDNLKSIMQPINPLNNNTSTTTQKRGYNSITTDVESGDKTPKEGNKPTTAKSNKSKSAFKLVSYAALGKYGGPIGLASFLLMNMSFMLSICIMIWELITDILVIFEIDLINPAILYLITFILYIISSSILNWKQMTIMSNIGVISIIAVVLTIFGICIYSLYEYDFSPPPIAEMAIGSKYVHANSNNIALNARKGMSELERVTFVFVLFIFGISGNGAIPSITVNLKDPSKIPMIVSTSYILVACFNICIGSIGFWLYGGYVDVMILNDFYLWPGGFVMLIVTILVILNVWSSFSISLTLIGEVFDGWFGLKLDQKGYRKAVRFGLSACIFIASYVLRHHLSFIVALSSAICVVCSLALTLPLTIYIAVFWNESSYLKNNNKYEVYYILYIISDQVLPADQLIILLHPH